MEELSGRAASDETFRSVKTGYSFYDLYYRFELIRENVLSDIFAEILDKKITKDQDVLLSKYSNRISEYEIENIKYDDESDEIWNIVESYVNMMSESNNTNITYEYIINVTFSKIFILIILLLLIFLYLILYILLTFTILVFFIFNIFVIFYFIFFFYNICVYTLYMYINFFYI